MNKLKHITIKRSHNVFLFNNVGFLLTKKLKSAFVLHEKQKINFSGKFLCSRRSLPVDSPGYIYIS